MTKPRVLILRAPGANCDNEAQFAFEQAGAVAERLHIQRLRENPKLKACSTVNLLAAKALRVRMPAASIKWNLMTTCYTLFR